VPPRVRHDTEGAEVVAALDDRDVGANRIAAPDHSERERRVLVRVVDGDPFGPPSAVEPGRSFAQRFVREHGKSLPLLGANDNVDEAAGARNQLAAFLLRDAARDGDDRIAAQLSAHFLDLAEPGVELLLGALANTARIDHHEIRVAFGIRAIVAGLLEQARHALGVVDAHLAAVGFDEVLHDFRFRLSPFAFAFE
jgi:hypothetical protein